VLLAAAAAVPLLLLLAAAVLGQVVRVAGEEEAPLPLEVEAGSSYLRNHLLKTALPAAAAGACL
jgi:hypothetical protein